MKMPQVGMPNWKWYFEGEKMKLLRWILGLVLLGVVVSMVIIFWPTIMQTGQRYVNRSGVRESDELDDFSAAA